MPFFIASLDDSFEQSLQPRSRFNFKPLDAESNRQPSARQFGSRRVCGSARPLVDLRIGEELSRFHFVPKVTEMGRPIVATLELIPAWKPRRKILGMSAILLPFASNGDVDWAGLRNHITRTLDAGLVPAVNMDTGYANLIDEKTRVTVLEETQRLAAGRMFVAGAFVGDQPGALFNFDAYAAQIESIQRHGGTPVIFQSYGLTRLPDTELIGAYEKIGSITQQFIGFELGQMFAPFGRIYSLDAYRELIKVPAVHGREAQFARPSA